MYLVDTNVVSEARKGARTNKGVKAFWCQATAQAVYLPVQVLGEIRTGAQRIKNRGDEKQAKSLENWLDTLSIEYADRILSFDSDCAQVWGLLMARRPQNPIDNQIAAIALVYDLTIVTRNVADFSASGVTIENPFS